MDTLLEKVKANLILEHSADDALLQGYAACRTTSNGVPGNDLKKVFPMVAFKSTGTAGRAIIWLSMRRRQRSFGSSTTIT